MDSLSKNQICESPGGVILKSPDECTSLTCEPPKTHCPKCSHAIFKGDGEDENGKMWRWTFSPMFGPLFLRKDGEPLVDQPMEYHYPVWGPFEEWQIERGLK